MGQFDRLPSAERDYWITRWEMQRLTCPDCGNPLKECSDPERAWYPYRRICYATMELKAAEAAYGALHENLGYHDGTFTSWAKDRGDEHPYAANSGVAIGVAKRDVAPHDKFTTERDASPLRSVAEQAPSKQDEADGAEQDGDYAE